MSARAIDEAEARLLELHHEERYRLGLSAVALAASLAMTAIDVRVARPLFVGGLAVGVLGMRTFWQRWDIVDRIADERDAYVIPEVLSTLRAHLHGAPEYVGRADPKLALHGRPRRQLSRPRQGRGV